MSAPASSAAAAAFELFDARDLERIERTERHRDAVELMATAIYTSGFTDGDPTTLYAEEKRHELRARILTTLVVLTPENREDLVARVIYRSWNMVCSDYPPYGLVVLLEHIHTAAGLLHIIRCVALAYVSMKCRTEKEPRLPGPWFAEVLARYAHVAQVAVEDLHIDALLRGAFRMEDDKWKLSEVYHSRDRSNDFAQVNFVHWLHDTMSEMARVWYTPDDERNTPADRNEYETLRRRWYTQFVAPQLEPEERQSVRDILTQPEWRIKPRAANGRHHSAATRRLASSYQQVRPIMATDPAGLVLGFRYGGGGGQQQQEESFDWRREQAQQREIEQRVREQAAAAGRLASRLTSAQQSSSSSMDTQ